MNWRSRFPVLVVQADTLGALGVIRSLGRAGYPVHAVATRADGLGLRSAFALQKVVCPDYASPAFLPWLRTYLRAQDIRGIVPSEGLLLALRPVFDEFANLLSCGDREEIVFAGMSKFDLVRSLLDSAGVSQGAHHLPPSMLVPDTAQVPSPHLLRQLGAPLYVKVDGSHARAGQAGKVVKAATPEAAHEALLALAPDFKRALVQGHVAGQGVGAFFLLHKGEVLAEFMHRRLHEVPHTGGASSYRESWYHQGIRDDALAKLRHMKWQGVAMMEYRCDSKSDEFHFVEMNGRFWGSLHLALFAGVDFPALLMDAFFGRPSPVQRQYPLGVRCRYTFPGELQHLSSKLRDPNLGWGVRLSAILEFAVLSADPRVHSDLRFPGDEGLYWQGLRDAWTRARGLPAKLTRTAESKVNRNELKRTILKASKWMGLFKAARFLTRDRLRILCYHGTALQDEAAFRPMLFIDPRTFERRLDYLQAQGFPVLSLEAAAEQLRNGKLPPSATVITIDDGFFSTYRYAVQALKARKIPATLYVTTYYAQKGTPIFRLMVQYAYWAAKVEQFSLDALGLDGFSGTAVLGADRENDPRMWQLIEFGETQLDEPGRKALAQKIAALLSVDWATVEKTRALSLMTPEEIREAVAAGIDVQLHTHRHRFPEDEAQAKREISENRAVLEPIAGKSLEHFCYPSGLYSRSQWQWLREIGVKTATTCDVGFSTADTPPLGLKRIFDGAHVSDLEFEAEMHGFSEIVRRTRSKVRGLRGKLSLLTAPAAGRALAGPRPGP
jgi:peptidoglycan/xylan/chitin deacetylase (PgdA/CDA1 family)